MKIRVTPKTPRGIRPVPPDDMADIRPWSPEFDIPNTQALDEGGKMYNTTAIVDWSGLRTWPGSVTWSQWHCRLGNNPCSSAFMTAALEAHPASPNEERPSRFLGSSWGGQPWLFTVGPESKEDKQGGLCNRGTFISLKWQCKEKIPEHWK